MKICSSHLLWTKGYTCHQIKGVWQADVKSAPILSSPAVLVCPRFAVYGQSFQSFLTHIVDWLVLVSVDCFSFAIWVFMVSLSFCVIVKSYVCLLASCQFLGPRFMVLALLFWYYTFIILLWYILLLYYYYIILLFIFLFLMLTCLLKIWRWIISQPACLRFIFVMLFVNPSHTSDYYFFLSTWTFNTFLFFDAISTYFEMIHMNQSHTDLRNGRVLAFGCMSL